MSLGAHALQLMLAFSGGLASGHDDTGPLPQTDMLYCVPGLLGNVSSWHPAVNFNGQEEKN